MGGDLHVTPPTLSEVMSDARFLFSLDRKPTPP